MARVSSNRALIFAVVLLLPYCLLTLFIFPSGDDFSYASIARGNLSIHDVLHERYRWNGRYLSNFFVMLNPIRWGFFSSYKLVVLGCIFWHIHALYYFLRQWMACKKQVCLFTLIFNLLCFILLPSISEGIYWYTSVVTYLLSAVFFWYYLSFLSKYILHANVKAVVFAFVLILIFSGLNESILLLNLVILSLMLALNFKNWRVWSFLLLTQFLLFVYVLKAPGNELRASNFENKHDVWQTLLYATLYTIRFIGEWLLSPPILLGILLLLKLKVNLKIKPNPNQLLVLTLLLLLPTYLFCAAAIWSTGMLGQYRSPNLALLFFVPTLFFLVLSIKKYLLKIQWLHQIKSKYILLLFALSLVLWKNAYKVNVDLFSGKAHEFHSAQVQRLALIKDCIERSEKDCTIPKLPSAPSIKVYDITNNPYSWLNHVYGQYFNAELKIVPSSK